MRAISFCVVLTLILGLVDCGGSGAGAGGAAPVATSGGGNAGAIAFRILIPNAAPGSSGKRRAFVSPSANGAMVTTYAASNENAPLATAVTDISSSSSACTSGSGGRTCTVTVSAPAGSDYFVFALYNEAPSNGAIPSGAQELGVAGVTQTIAAGQTNTVDAPISAIIAGLGLTPQSVDEPADGRQHTISFVVAPTDFGDNPITAGSSNAPYANPITVSVSESGGSGYTLLSLDGGTPSASVTLTKATDTVEAIYDGGGTTGYSATVTLDAPAYNGQGGASESATIAPLFVANNTVFYSSSPAGLDTYPEGQHVLLISEPGAAGSTTYTATPSGCSNILSVGTVVGRGTSATLLVAGGTQTSTGGCSLAISDGTVTFTIAVTNTLRSAPGSSPTIKEYGVGANAPFGITTGADGNLWFTEAGGVAVSYVNRQGTGYTSYPLSSQGFDIPYGDTLGPDGNVWFGDDATHLVGKVTTAGNVTVFSGQSYDGTNTIAPDLDGNVWFSESGGPVVGSINATSGTLDEVTVPVSNAEPFGVALGADGAIWFGDCVNDAIGRIASGTASEFAATTSQSPVVLAAGSDGALWFTETTNIGRMSSSGTLTEYPITTGTPNVAFITPGPDGALWFTDIGNNAIGRITTSGSITEYPVPTGGAAPIGITVGPDGNIWFTENSVGDVGEVEL